MERNIQEQGFSVGDFDILIGANVLHATRNICRTIRNVKAILKSNGILVLNEITSVQDYTTLTFGLLKGWWLFEDGDNRLPDSPLLSTALWEKVLKEEGFDDVIAIKNTNDYPSLQHVLLAESNGLVHVSGTTKYPVHYESNETQNVY